MAFQFKLQYCTLSKIFNTNKAHWDYFVIGVPSQRIKTSFKREQHWGIQYIIEISDGTKLQLALDCLHIQAADRNTLLHCEGVFMDTTTTERPLQLWPVLTTGVWGLCTGRGNAIGHTRSHDFSHSHIHKQTRFVPWDCCCARLSY